MGDNQANASSRRPRVPWDGYRKAAAWAGVLEFAAVIALLLTVGGRLGGSGTQDDVTTWTIVLALMAPAVLAGLISGSRFIGLYAGYAERLDPRDQLSQADAARGTAAGNSVIGDALWGSLIGGIAGSIPATAGFTLLFGPAAVIFAPVFVLVGALAWFTGWAAGAVVSLVLGTAVGIVIGTRASADRAGRAPWVVAAAFLPALLVTVALAVVGVRVDGAPADAWTALFVVSGAAIPGAEFVLGDPLLWVARIAFWLALALFITLVVVGAPALIARGSRRVDSAT